MRTVTFVVEFADDILPRPITHIESLPGTKVISVSEGNTEDRLIQLQLLAERISVFNCPYENSHEDKFLNILHGIDGP